MMSKLLEIAHEIRTKGYLTMADKARIADTLEKIAGGKKETTSTPRPKPKFKTEQNKKDHKDIIYAKNLVLKLTGELTKASIEATMAQISKEHNSKATSPDLLKQLKGTYNDLKKLHAITVV